ncbi:uncharacterized protein LOC129221070 [Uloborus diversus]|uniref:uncharacterized protein LOC129221070 n=1 Tax=Uloborus diversus TaxID=327109 RepID=UPI00240A16ED|nr:uncharacterized protein LOC129221070 [Uloborus diversus]
MKTSEIAFFAAGFGLGALAGYYASKMWRQAKGNDGDIERDSVEVRREIDDEMDSEMSNEKAFLATALPDGPSASRQSNSEGPSSEGARYGTRTAPTKCHRSICPANKRLSPADGQRKSARDQENRVTFPKQDKAKFSRKYDSQGMPEDSGFVPLLDPYGKKPNGRRAPRHRPIQPKQTKELPGKTAPRTTLPKSRSHAKLRVRSSVKNFKGQKPPKGLPSLVKSPPQEELSARESVAEENLLGNGRFEIIRGGMFSDLEENEIAGSRRSGRGGHYDAYQTNYNAMQNFQFPRYYLNRGPMAPYHPMFFPRAALSAR